MKAVLSAASVLALVAGASAHAMVNPALGVKGTPQRSDTQRPSANSPCGSVNIAQNLDSSTATAAGADGSVTVQFLDFNAGGDGSRSVSVQVSADGSGKNLVAGTVTTNGDANPTKTGSDKIVFKLPANTKCTGGAKKNLCLVSVKSTAGFGGCTVVSQGNVGAAQPPAAASTSSTKVAAQSKTTTKAAAQSKSTNKAATQQMGSQKKGGNKKKKAGKGKGKGKKGKGGKGKGKGKKAGAAKANTANVQATQQKEKMMKEGKRRMSFDDLE